eukprot:TRINITY_DN2740_c0_g1_i1.p1 TRINITY_DN2740_c0_g1~~TRINITY_DN2740_c0_g1_i1.p1  ORF type:complete len:164 (-),score=10.60 TRINITY_DN2740_c0_g1_i1:189-650(-)
MDATIIDGSLCDGPEPEDESSLADLGGQCIAPAVCENLCLHVSTTSSTRGLHIAEEMSGTYELTADTHNNRPVYSKPNSFLSLIYWSETSNLEGNSNSGNPTFEHFGWLWIVWLMDCHSGRLRVDLWNMGYEAKRINRELESLQGPGRNPTRL